MNLEEYDRMYELEDRYWWFVGRRWVAIQLLFKNLSSEKRPLVLDLGCGTGAVTKEIAAGAQVIGFDMCEKALGYSQKRNLDHLIQGECTKLPFIDGQFDGAMGLDLYEHIEDDYLAFSETFRILKPGGCLVLSVPAYRMLWGPHDIALHHKRRYRAKQLTERLSLAGFKVTLCSHAVFWLFPAVVLTRILEKMRPGPAKASLPHFPEWANRLLIRLQIWEGASIADKERTKPWGSSIVVVARKP